MKDNKPRLARFDRPALDLEELMSATGADFVHAAYWSILDRRASPEEVKSGVELLNATMAPEDFLIMLSTGEERCRKKISQLYLDRLLAMQREARPALILVFFDFMDSKLTRRKFGLYARIYAQRIAAVMRWTYRHSRKACIRTMRRIAISARRLLPIRHSPPPPDMTPRSAYFYIRLCQALDRGRNSR